MLLRGGFGWPHCVPGARGILIQECLRRAVPIVDDGDQGHGCVGGRDGRWPAVQRAPWRRRQGSPPAQGFAQLMLNGLGNGRFHGIQALAGMSP